MHRLVHQSPLRPLPASLLCTRPRTLHSHSFVNVLARGCTGGTDKKMAGQSAHFRENNLRQHYHFW